jgi:hypothetical protein
MPLAPEHLHDNFLPQNSSNIFKKKKKFKAPRKFSGSRDIILSKTQHPRPCNKPRSRSKGHEGRGDRPATINCGASLSGRGLRDTFPECGGIPQYVRASCQRFPGDSGRFPHASRTGHCVCRCIITIVDVSFVVVDVSSVVVGVSLGVVDVSLVVVDASLTRRQSSLTCRWSSLTRRQSSLTYR